MNLRLTIKARLACAMGLLGLLLVVASVLGLVGMSDATNRTYAIYSNNLPSAIAIGNANTFVLRERVVLDRAALTSDRATLEGAFAQAKKFRALSNDWWAKYLALPRGAEEDRLVQVVAAKRQTLYAAIDEFVAAIQSGDTVRTSAASAGLAEPANEMSDAADALTTFQSGDARTNYERSRSQYALYRNAMFTMIVLGLAASLFAWLSLRRAIGVPLGTALRHFDEIAAGDLRRPVHVASRDEMGQLLAGLAKMRDSLLATVRTVRHGSESIASASMEIASGNADLSSRTEEQAASLEQTAASMEELTGTVRQNTENARQASALARNASDIAGRGNEVVSKVVGTMTEINDSSSKIADIIGMIESIAFQTNILALNAAVEAARAGEQGRGFAVVAGEVRALAQRSSSAAKEIKDLIDTSVARVRAGTELVDQAGATMQEIIGAVSRVTDIMGEIAAASDEQSTGIEQVGRAITQMDDVTQQNAALVEQASAAAQSLENQAARLKAAVAIFQFDEGPGTSGLEPNAPRTGVAAPARRAVSRAAKALPTPPRARVDAAQGGKPHANGVDSDNSATEAARTGDGGAKQGHTAGPGNAGTDARERHAPDVAKGDREAQGPNGNASARGATHATRVVASGAPSRTTLSDSASDDWETF